MWPGLQIAFSFPLCRQKCPSCVKGIETNMSKEITALDVLTSSMILGKWLRPALKRKMGNFYGKGGWATTRLKDAALSDDKLREGYFKAGQAYMFSVWPDYSRGLCDSIAEY
uniref:Uncharacterized protein n=1 Tax=Oryza barthii TaxID=65489 RepID=A0A0D3GMI1_9ORYZ